MDRLHKSAHGRTSVFTVDPTVTLRSIRTSSTVASGERGARAYHRVGWKPVGPVSCWHCCEPVSGEPYPLPRVYDAVERKFHVVGFFCSLECCKAHILDTSTFDRGNQLAMLERMAREVYGVEDTIVETAPRISLQRFGGPFPPPSAERPRAPCRLLEPPFISYCMLAEERAKHRSLATTTGALDPLPDESYDLDNEREPPRSMYTAFMDGQRAARAAAPEPAPPLPAPAADASAMSTLRRFSKRHKS